MTSPNPNTNLSTELDKAAAFAQDPDVSAPLAAALERAAIAVMTEAGNVEGHALRTNLAIQVLQNPKGFWERFAWAVSTNTEVVGNWASEDRAAAVNSFQFVVDSVWNAMAGVIEPESAPAPAA